jgi:tetratricopeptide (TPR) repeat protein
MNQPPFKQQQLLSQAQRLHAAGETPAALKIYQQLHKSDPQNPRLLYLLGAAEMSMGQTPEARAHLSAALKRNPGDVGAWHDLAMVEKRDGRFGESLAALDRAYKLRPGDPTLCAARSGVHFMRGEFEAAAAALEPVLAAEPPHAAVAIAFSKVASRLGRQDEAIGRLRTLADREGLPVSVMRDVLFGLGTLLDGQKRFDEAFEAIARAHATRTGRHDPDEFSRAVDATIRAWTPEAMRNAPRGKTPNDRPVFIVGMPRSGTSLVEQILASHPKVFGAGELNDVGRAVFELTGARGGFVPPLEDPSKLTRAWVDRLELGYLDTLRKLSSSASRVTDKMPSNFLHVGPIAAAFPRARIIHCIRDARDTCLSCFFQNFGGLHLYAASLPALGRYYRDYERLMAHWKSLAPVPILDVRYEELLDDLEGVSRRMVGFLGLEWDPACLEFHKSDRIVRTSSNDQVRRPLYRGSVGRWRNYEGRLGALIAALVPGGGA